MDIEVDDLTMRFGARTALDGMSLRLQGGAIHGLLGRNGSGKSTLLCLLASFTRPTSGTVRIGGADPYENAELMASVCLIREAGDVAVGERVAAALTTAADLRPYWDQTFADRLVERFRIPLTTRVDRLSRGQRAALAIVLGLSSRAPVTLLDEVHLGLDAPSRAVFYAELLEDYLAHPRTIVLSTHLIDEVASVFERVTIIDRGRTVIQEDAETLRTRGTSVIGPAAAVDDVVAGLPVLAERSLGSTKATTIYGALSESLRIEAVARGLELGPVGLQDLFIHLTGSAIDTEPAAIR